MGESAESCDSIRNAVHAVAQAATQAEADADSTSVSGSQMDQLAQELRRIIHRDG